jgi:hypothetical protein
MLIINSGNYRLLADSAAIDKGINTGISIDLDGNAQPENPYFDIGAYEYQGVRWYIFLPLALKNF